MHVAGCNFLQHLIHAKWKEKSMYSNECVWQNVTTWSKASFLKETNFISYCSIIVLVCLCTLAQKIIKQRNSCWWPRNNRKDNYNNLLSNVYIQSLLMHTSQLYWMLIYGFLNVSNSLIGNIWSNLHTSTCGFSTGLGHWGPFLHWVPLLNLCTPFCNNT